jgi:hypothetical protein
MFSTQTSKTGDEKRSLIFAVAENAGTGDEGSPTGGNDSLEDVAEREHEYLRQRLRDELKREPTEEELDEWLREHTEGY